MNGRNNSRAISPLGAAELLARQGNPLELSETDKIDIKRALSDNVTNLESQLDRVRRAKDTPLRGVILAKLEATISKMEKLIVELG